ncbi:MAG: hypothetical protein HRT64_13680, partial [Erythrobacter sp.]|nr:hypothetical protein [Erythrobacter sp.]
MRQALTRWSLTGLVTLLAACTSLPEPPSVPENRVTVGQSPWTATGKLILKTEEVAESVRFRWHRLSPTREVITLSGPLGMGAVKLVREDAGIYWFDGERAYPLDQIDLTPGARRILTNLPLTELGDWLVGASGPASDDWELTISQSQTIQGLELP